MKRVSILGATGSIGQSTLDLIRSRPDAYKVVALTGGQNIAQLAADAREFGAELAVTADPVKFDALRDALSGSGIEVAAGAEALIEAAQRPVDWTMSAIVGFAGLAPGLAALEQGQTLALANKESLVTAGPLLLATARRFGATILPVDSEHSAIFQALVGEDPARIERVIITASGGAFRDWPLEDLSKATLAEASTHPNWDMGQRITIDSATMFNKALEVIEAKEFFDLNPEQIEVVVHPESIIHSMVGFVDKGLMAHLGPPDMRHAIGYALHWPERAPLSLERLDFAKLGTLSFREPEPERYPALQMAHDVMRAGGLMGAVFNGAKERALDHFIAGQIGFCDMSDLVAETLGSLSGNAAVTAACDDLEAVRRVDTMAREHVDMLVMSRKK